MKLLVTGASGFLGQSVVAAALQHNHQVQAVVRPATKVADIAWAQHANVELVRLDLRNRSAIAAALAGVDVVIHLAACKAGDFYDQFVGTVLATENLLGAMVETDIKRLVAISTFSVYDYINMRNGATLDEDSPLMAEPATRDEYAQTKLIQENLVRDFEQTQGGAVTILRPGIVYGKDNLWNASLGAGLGEGAWLRIGAYAKLPLTYVENCADAIILATEQSSAIGQTLNIIDDNLPSQRRYTKQLLCVDPNPPKLVPINWTIMSLLGRLAWGFNQSFLDGKAKLPSILVPSRLDARFKPFKYSNQKIKQCLNWTPEYTLEAALARSIEGETAPAPVQKSYQPTVSTPV